MAKVERFEDEALGHTSQQCRVCSPAAPGADLARGRKGVETKKILLKMRLIIVIPITRLKRFFYLTRNS